MKTQKNTHGAKTSASRKRHGFPTKEVIVPADKLPKAARAATPKMTQVMPTKVGRKQKGQLIRDQKFMQSKAWLRYVNSLHKDDEASTMLGGMKSSSIKAKGSYTHTPIEDERPEEQRHAIWQPPQTDKSRFSGTSSSRHRATASYKVGADYETIAYDDEYKDSKPGEKEKKKGKGKQNKKKRKAKGKAKDQGGSASQPSRKASGSKKQQGTFTTSPLSAHEIQILDRNYRIYGGKPSWKGWDTLIPHRSKQFLFSQVYALGLDKPDDRTWSKGEKAVFRDHKHKLLASSPQWKIHLPRKSERAIRRAYADRLA